MPRNGLAERRAVRRQAVLAVRFRRLCENGTAAARLFCGLIRTVSALDAVLANDGDRAGRHMLNF